MMIFKAIRILGKASTLAWAAKTGYDAYKVGNTAFSAYKKVREAKAIVHEVKRVVKRKP